VKSFVAAWPSDHRIQVISTPAYVCLVARSAALREEVRLALIARSVYPIVLWPLLGNDIPRRHRELSERILLLHADDRYKAADMSKVADICAEVMN
jgi:hypothetical protein